MLILSCLNGGIGGEFQWIKYLVTDFGTVGPYYQGTGIYYYLTDGNAGLGQMKFSQDGSKLINTRGKHLDIYDFDRCMGEFYHNHTIQNITDTYLYGANFHLTALKYI